jgi:hypothetical protein
MRCCRISSSTAGWTKSPSSAKCSRSGRGTLWSYAHSRDDAICPRATLRGWWGRFRARSPTLLAEVLEVAIRLDPAPVDLRLKAEAAVFEALDQGLARARARFGDHLADVWRFWSRISGGQVLATNTSASWRNQSDRSWMAASP